MSGSKVIFGDTKKAELTWNLDQSPIRCAGIRTYRELAVCAGTRRWHPYYQNTNYPKWLADESLGGGTVEVFLRHKLQTIKLEILIFFCLDLELGS